MTEQEVFNQIDRLLRHDRIRGVLFIIKIHYKKDVSMFLSLYQELEEENVIKSLNRQRFTQEEKNKQKEKLKKIYSFINSIIY